MISLTIALAITLAIVVTQTYADLGRPVLFQDGIDTHVGASFWANLKPTQSTWDPWGWGFLPQTCFNGANDNGVNPYDMEIFNVHYADNARRGPKNGNFLRVFL